MKAFKLIRRLVAIGSLSVISMIAGVSNADPVVVSRANMQNWTLNVFDGGGNIVTGAPYSNGTAAMVTGPATPPLGVGSAHLATAPGGGDGAAAIATEQFDGTPLAAITSLSYAEYCTTSSNGSQVPYLAVSINTGAVDTTGAGNVNALDTLFLEPAYQQPAYTSQTNQGTTQLDEWQTWNADQTTTGAFWDNQGFLSTPGANEGPSEPGVQPLSAFIAAYPDATIANGGFAGLGGIAMQVGFASSGDAFDGNVDAFTIGIAGVNTTYDFEPTPVPEPASMGLICLAGSALLMRRKKRTA
jgi:hypothetical protein